MPQQNARLNLLVLSPHRGDAAFWLFTSISTWLRAGHTVTLLNAFTRSMHAPFSDADSVHENDRLSYVSAMRRKEDEALLRQLPGIVITDANIKDAPLRLHIPEDTVYEIPLDPNDGALPKIRKALTRHLTQPNPAFVIPLGSPGSHIDQRIAREAAEPLLVGHPHAFYAARPEAVPQPPPDFNLIATPAGAGKRKAILLYNSQIDETEAARILEAGERIWANQPFLAQIAQGPSTA